MVSRGGTRISLLSLARKGKKVTTSLFNDPVHMDEFDAESKEPLDKLFDVTQVIGSVYASPYGNGDPHMVAMMLIAEHTCGGIGGTFQFPSDSGMTSVRVEHSDAV